MNWRRFVTMHKKKGSTKKLQCQNVFCTPWKTSLRVASSLPLNLHNHRCKSIRNEIYFGCHFSRRLWVTLFFGHFWIFPWFRQTFKNETETAVRHFAMLNGASAFAIYFILFIFYGDFGWPCRKTCAHKVHFYLFAYISLCRCAFWACRCKTVTAVSQQPVIFDQ